ncbi:hypothetical protein LZ016_05125 [Sphingomonas sp. SM33]|uniref:Apea-like HEPN domain-containing protein n=1 Tax=Sphingomonas telluris TaxID=2907998 RepID=A0ABS9VM24_9SPHN|nr:hypothetical protein [Sphingomonas telluris]MCH8615482.1 hypothetical protein [Sphingomonas telluris]
MLLRDTAKFNGLDNKEGLLFFAQRFEEATFDYSLDSHRAPAVNIPSLVYEAFSQVGRLMREEPGVSEASIEPIISELCKRLSARSAYKSMFVPERDILSKLRTSDMAELQRNLSVLRDEISQRTYINEVMKQLISAVNEGKKGIIERLVLELVSSLENMGVSRKHLYLSVVKFFFENVEDVLDDHSLQDFFKEVYPHHHKFEVCFSADRVVTDISQSSLSMLGLKVSTKLPKPFATNAEAKDFMGETLGSRYLLVSDVPAYDPYSAIQTAEAKVGIIQNLFRVYHHKRHFSLGPKVVLEQGCCANEIKCVFRDQSRIHSSTDDRPQKAAKRLDTLLQKSALPRGVDRTRFESISEFHSMSLEAESPQNQLLNLWISLETLAPSRAGKSKVDDVIAAVTPCIGLAYVRRLFERASYDLLRWNRREVTRALQNFGGKDSSITQRVLLLLTHSSSEPALAQLFDKMGDFELLRYRCFTLRSEFRDQKAALEKINAHQERVVWQLRRIYRARNLVVHQGTSPAWLRSVIETAHEYFDQALESANDFSCGSSGFKTYARIFNYAKMELEAYHRRLEDAALSEEDFRSRLIWARPRYATRADVLIGAPE